MSHHSGRLASQQGRESAGWTRAGREKRIAEGDESEEDYWSCEWAGRVARRGYLFVHFLGWRWRAGKIYERERLGGGLIMRWREEIGWDLMREIVGSFVTGASCAHSCL